MVSEILSNLSNHYLDSGNYYLGTLCKRAHSFNSTGKSIRNNIRRECVECVKQRKRKPLKERPRVEVNELLFLGALCKHGHEHNGTGLSLRYKSCGGCTQCRGVQKVGRNFSDEKLNFLSRVLKPDGEEGCWIWDGARNKSGYGFWSFQGERTLAHRASLILLGGLDPQGFLVCHKCDNPPCVNPAHLFLGTTQDNSSDMVRKCRQSRPKGEKHPGAKLTWDKVNRIRQMSQSGCDAKTLSQVFGVTPSMIRNVVAQRNWQDAAN